MRRRAIEAGFGLLAVLLLAPAALNGQAEERMREVRERYPAESAERIERIVERARAQGVPTRPILDKALEGAAKGVPAPRVIRALETYSARLGRARDLLGPGSPPGAVVAGADALRRGAPPEAVTSVGREAGPRSPVALVTLGDLVEARVPSERALELIGQALSRGAGEETLLSAPGAVRRMVRRGTPPGAAARAVARAIRAGRPPVPPGSRDPRRRPPRDAGDRGGADRGGGDRGGGARGGAP